MKRAAKELINFLLILAGILSAGMGLKGFLLSSKFIDGGVTGISMLLTDVSSLPLAFWLPLVNAPFIIIAFFRLGAAFALRSILAISGLALVLVFLPYPDVTPDRLLTAVFGGFFIGAGVGLTIRGGAVLDGTEIAALLVSKRIQFLKVGDVILACNILIFLAALLVLGVEAALYSILTYFAAAKTLNFVLYGVEELTAILIVSEKSEAIRQTIVEDLGRGVTSWKGFGGKTEREREVLYCVVTILEIGRIKDIARTIDESAFVTVHPLADVSGGTVKQLRHL